MSAFRPRPRPRHGAHRRHRPTLPDDLAARCGCGGVLMWRASDDAPMNVDDFVDALGLAWAVIELPVRRDCVVLLDGKRVVGMIFDPQADDLVDLAAWGHTVAFSAALLIVVFPAPLEYAPAPADLVQRLEVLRADLAAHGIRLLDIIRVHAENAQSVAISAGIEHPWFDDSDDAA